MPNTTTATNENENKKTTTTKKNDPKTSRDVGQLTSEDYDRILAEYNGLLAAAESEFGLMDRAGGEARVAYDEARARHRAVLGEIGRQINGLETDIVRSEAEKARLIAGLAAEQAALEAADEQRRAQYSRVLDGLRLDIRFAEGNYKSFEASRADLLDEIVVVKELKKRLEQDQHDRLYAAEQIQVAENVMIISDQKKNFQNCFEIIKNNKKYVDRLEILKNLTKKNIMTNKLSESRKKYYTTNIEKEKFYHELDNKRIYENINTLKNECSVTSMMNNTYNRLTKQKEIAQLKKNQLINKALNQETLQEKYLKNVKALMEFEYDENHMIHLVNSLKKELINAKDSRKQKLNYVKKMYEEIAIIIERANKFITGESKDTLKGFEWLQNKGIVRHLDGKPEYIS